jgi:membrane-associated phospholipid phosphatase
MGRLQGLKEKFWDFWEETILNKILIFVIITWIILAIVFGFTDLAISQAIIDNNSAWGNVGQEYGEAPGWGFIAIAIVIVIGNYLGERAGDIKKQKSLAYLLIIIGLLALLVGIALKEDEIAIYGGAVGISVLFFTIITRNKDWNNYKNFAIIVLLLAIINPLLFVQIFKLVWGRYRPNKAISGEGPYTPWFVINGFTGEQSFPSGHTAMGFMFLPLLMLIKRADLEKFSHRIISVLGVFLVIGWGIFVGASRVALWDHFSSDVLFSAGMASVVTIILYKKVYLTGKFSGRFKVEKKRKKIVSEEELIMERAQATKSQKDMQELSRSLGEEIKFADLDDEFPFED